MRSAQESTQQTMLVTNIAAAVTIVHRPADTGSPSRPLSGVGPSLSHTGPWSSPQREASSPGEKEQHIATYAPGHVTNTSERKGVS